MGVSLVATVMNEERSIVAFLDSIRDQTRPPNEVVIVDGGSADQTVALISAYRGLPVRCLVHPSNIATGRNIAIADARHDIIAVTDAGCRLSPDWLEKMTEIGEHVDVMVGNYRPLIGSFFDACQYAMTDLFGSDTDVRRFAISSRSLAFRRRVWEELGGYPEFLDHSEDTYFHQRIRAGGYRLRFVRDAVVFWEQRATVGAVLQQYFRYMKGDGMARINGRRHAARFGAYAAGSGLLGLSFSQPQALALLAAGFLAYASVPYRAFARLGRYRLLGPPLIALPLLLVMIDAAKMAGYIAGRFTAGRQSGSMRSPLIDRR